MDTFITKEWLDKNPLAVFVYGDNLQRRGYGGAAYLRDHPNTYGFITKKAPSRLDSAAYTPHEYVAVYVKEIAKLKDLITSQPASRFMISKIGSGLSNRFNIFEMVISPRIKKDLSEFSNVVFLWE